MILTPAKRSELIKTLSYLDAESLLSVVEAAAANAATVASTFEQYNYCATTALSQLYIRTTELLEEVRQWNSWRAQS